MEKLLYDNLRTLINQLFSSGMVPPLLFNLLVQIPTILRYLIGPYPAWICYLDLILRNIFGMATLFFLDAIVIVKYIFTIHTKNPTAGKSNKKIGKQCYLT
jgi:hypothetical protein